MEVTETGGAIIGRKRMSWPFASINVSEFKLELNASVAGTFVFRPGDILSIVPGGSGSFFASGLKITHTVTGYNSNIVFNSFDQVELLRKIHETGFLNNRSVLPYNIEQEISNMQTSGAFLFKKTAIIIVIGIWNLLILYDLWQFYQNNENGFFFGAGAKIALGFMLSVCFLSLIFKPFSRLLLKDGRDIDSVKKFIFFVAIITLILFVGFCASSAIIGR